VSLAGLRAVGCLFRRFAAEHDELRPQHIVHDFEPTLARLRHHGFEGVWRDTNHLSKAWCHSSIVSGILRTKQNDVTSECKKVAFR
jgi:hypothetical protein